MMHFETELQELSQLYQELSHALEGPEEADHNRGAAALIERILRVGDLVSRIEQMNIRISVLAAEWRKSAGHLDPYLKSSVQRISDSLRHEGSRLRNTLEQRSAQIDAHRRQLERRLADIQKGTRFLESVNPVKSNYPKFIDSVG